jgi:hypothetical protein
MMLAMILIGSHWLKCRLIQVPVQVLDTEGRRGLFEIAPEERSVSRTDHSRGSPAAISVSARWLRGEPGFKVFGPVSDQRAHFDEEWTTP